MPWLELLLPFFSGVYSVWLHFTDSSPPERTSMVHPAWECGVERGQTVWENLMHARLSTVCSPVFFLSFSRGLRFFWLLILLLIFCFPLFCHVAIFDRGWGVCILPHYIQKISFKIPFVLGFYLSLLQSKIIRRTHPSGGRRAPLGH